MIVFTYLLDETVINHSTADSFKKFIECLYLTDTNCIGEDTKIYNTSHQIIYHITWWYKVQKCLITKTSYTSFFLFPLIIKSLMCNVPKAF